MKTVKALLPNTISLYTTPIHMGVKFPEYQETFIIYNKKGVLHFGCNTPFRMTKEVL